MADKSPELQLRIRKVDAKVVAKRIRAVLAEEFSWNGTPKQATGLLAQFLGWSDQLAMEANFAPEKPAAPVSRLSTSGLHDQYQAVLFGSVCRFIELYEAINHAVPFHSLGRARFDEDNEDPKRAVLGEIEDWINPLPGLTKHIIDTLHQDDSRVLRASLRAAEAVRDAAVDLAELMWPLRAGYRQATTDLGNILSRAIESVESDMDEDTERLFEPTLSWSKRDLMRVTAQLLVRCAIAHENPGVLMDLSIDAASVATVEDDLVKIVAGKPLVLKFVQKIAPEESGKEKKSVLTAGKAAKFLVGNAMPLAQTLLHTYSHYLKHLDENVEL